MYIKPYDKFGNILYTKGDGACLFNSIATGILFYKNKSTSQKFVKSLSKKLRKETVERLKKFNKSLIAGMVNGTNSTSEKFTKYIEQMKLQQTWGGNIEVKVLNDIIKDIYKFRGVVIRNEDNGNKIKHMSGVIKRVAQYPIINLSLSHVNSGGCHFSFVIDSKLLYKCQK
tara:strand:+ start:26 stop:538 length:513 start_codon:yes stop_codon:yes gene_type:complete